MILSGETRKPQQYTEEAVGETPTSPDPNKQGV